MPPGPSDLFLLLVLGAWCDGRCGVADGKVLGCLAFLPTPSLNKRRKLGFVKVADALPLDLGFLGRSFCEREFSPPPQIFFSSSPPTNGVPDLFWSFFYSVTFLSVLPPLCVFGFWFFGSLLLTVFLHQWGLNCSPKPAKFYSFPYFGQIPGGKVLVCQKYMLSIIQFHAGSYQPRSLQVGAGGRSLLRMSSRVDRRAPQRRGLVSEEALFWNCPRTPLKSSPRLNSKIPFGLRALYRRLLVCCFSQAAQGQKQPFAGRMGFSSEGVVAFLWSGTLRAFPHCPGGALAWR